jgi:hypothetical protein
MSLGGGIANGIWLAHTYIKQAEQRQFFRLVYASA